MHSKEKIMNEQQKFEKMKTANEDHPDHDQCFIYDRHVGLTVIFRYYKFIK